MCCAVSTFEFVNANASKHQLQHMLYTALFIVYYSRTLLFQLTYCVNVFKEGNESERCQAHGFIQAESCSNRATTTSYLKSIMGSVEMSKPAAA